MGVLLDSVYHSDIIRSRNLAEGQGFEPWVRRRTLVFKTSAFDHSATPPEKRGASIPCDINLARIFAPYSFILPELIPCPAGPPGHLSPHRHRYAWPLGRLVHA